MKSNHIKYLSTLLLAGLGASPAMAQEATGVSMEQVLWLMIFTMVVVAVVCLLLVFTVLVLIREKYAQSAQATAEEGQAEAAQAERKPGIWATLMQKLTDAVPVEREEEVALDHDYDGIRELDNNLPPWWKWGFYFTIVFAAVYLYYYHIETDWSSTKQYEEEMAQAETQKAAFLAEAAEDVSESNVTLLTDATELAQGQELYNQLCIACHGAQGEGGIGPNLTDSYWIHGGGIKEVFSTIKYGVPEKGMISWQSQLRPQEMSQVASYVLSLQGTAPPNGKAPEGELYEPTEEAAPQAADSTSVASL